MTKELFVIKIWLNIKMKVDMCMTKKLNTVLRHEDT